MTKTKPIEERFWPKVQRTDGCWEWQASKDRKGYGRIIVDRFRGPMLAHRLSWAIHYGDPGEMCVLHRCDNPPCVNPAHLFLGTLQDNNADMIAKGRRRVLPVVTHCKRGHEYTPENTYIYRGCRSCIECKRQELRNRRAAQRKAS